MVTVQYAYEISYAHDPFTGDPFPILPLQVTNLSNPGIALDVNAYLDSGAQRSLFDGWIATSLGLDLLSGQALSYGSLGGIIQGRLHQVRLSHFDLGEFDLEIGFSENPIRRNLLGRDFFNLIQIGFRERYLTFYVTPTP
ncbi:MAG: hypothetical protein HY267_00510 [Deltaproteobacteria bacterium]|nr:hypothetical protein [Deltaproteobacteria bacterium]